MKACARETYAIVLMSPKNSKGFKQKTARMDPQMKNIKLPVWLILIPVSKTTSDGNERLTMSLFLYHLLVTVSQMSPLFYQALSLAIIYNARSFVSACMGNLKVVANDGICEVKMSALYV